jgi:thioredoxin-like negative regulator of GroEL
MLQLLAGLALAAAPAPSSCTGQAACVQASAAQLFALADQLYSSGDKAGAAQVLEALTHDKHPELRAEARFRLAAVRESTGDLKGAADALRALLAEQPNANRARLELARILGRMGNGREAQAELGRAEKLGLPPEVQQNVRRLSATLATPKRRGLTLELTTGPDSNINRATGSAFIDTIIAPFQLDADARRQAGEGYSGSARGYSRDSLGKVSILSEAAVRADLYSKGRFDDVQLSLDSGPQIGGGKLSARPALVYERRWFGNRPYSTGWGASFDATLAASPETQLALSASETRQSIARNSGQDGWRTFIGADLLRAFGGGTLARLSVRYGRLDARDRPESLRQRGAGLLVARQARSLTLFGEIEYTRTNGIAPTFLFGETRRDQRWDLTGGVILNRAKLAGFSPLMRITHTTSSANIALFDYRRTRLDIGVTRSY